MIEKAVDQQMVRQPLQKIKNQRGGGVGGGPPTHDVRTADSAKGA